MSLRHLWKAHLGLLLALLVPTAAVACGLPLQARIPAEQALIIYSGGQQQIISSVQLEAAEPGAAVIFPVPGVPEVDQPAGGAELFAYLEQATQPERRVERVVRWGADEGAMAGAPAGGVSVLGREVLGGYDVARLAAADPGELARWLDTNGYQVPPAAQPILEAYIDEGWKFVAVRLADVPAAGGSLSPLRMRFAAAQIVYPMRLGALADSPLDIQLYLLDAHRMEITGMQTLFAGPTAGLTPAPEGPLAQLLGSAPYLTRLRAPALAPGSIGGDFVARRAPSDEPYREVVTVYRSVTPLQAYGLPVALACVVVLSITALVGAISIRQRIDRI